MAEATVIDLESLPAILTLKHVQDILGISRQTASNLARRPGFPLLRLESKTLRIPRSRSLMVDCGTPESFANSEALSPRSCLYRFNLRPT